MSTGTKACLVAALLWVGLPTIAARFFTASSSQYYTATTSGLTYPITLACWAKVNSTAASRAAIAICNTSTGNRTVILLGSFGVGCNFGTTGSGGSSTTVATSWTSWHHVAVTVADSGGTLTGVLWVDGTPTTTTPTQANSAPGWNSIVIGARHNGTSYGLPMDGDIDLAAIYTTGLNASEIGQLAAGAHPTSVRPDALRHCWEIAGEWANEPDSVGGLLLVPAAAATGSTTQPRRQIP